MSTSPATLLGIEVVTANDVTAKLVQNDGKLAMMELQGNVAGAIGGVATDIDRQYPGQTAGASLAESLDSTFGFVGLENIYRVGSPVVREILGNWDRWQDGPPPVPN